MEPLREGGVSDLNKGEQEVGAHAFASALVLEVGPSHNMEKPSLIVSLSSSNDPQGSNSGD